MKQRLILTVILGILATVYGFSQSITSAEYFLDNDPGVGEGVPITLTVPFDTIEQTFDIVLLDTLEVGYHWLYIRSRDADGKWSIVKGHKIHVFEDANPNMLEDQPEIAGLEYFIDMEPGVGMGTWIANSATIKDTIEETLDKAVAGLSPGYHKLYARSKDTEGTWSLLMWRKFFVFEDTVIRMDMSSAPLVAAEYYFDDEVPLGGGTPIAVTRGDSIEWSGVIEVTGLEAGEHHLLIRVQDSVGQWSIAYSQAFSIVGLTSLSNSPICQGSDEGEAKIRITGGKPPFTFLWDDPEQQADSVATGLKAGSYTVTVQDAEGAVIKETVEITEWDTIGIDITTSDTECKAEQGSATAVPSGDNQPFDYLWTTGSEEDNISGLASGIYEVTVTDNIGCQNKAIATINDIGGPEIDIDDRVKHLVCAGDADGEIRPEVSKGTAPYTFSWSTGETSQDIMNLKAGTYELTVTDATGCIANHSIRVEEPQPVTYSFMIVQADCGVENGSATVSVMGGVQPYAYNWKGLSPPHNATRTGLGAGVYEISIIDNEGCSALAQLALGESGASTVNVTAINQSTCGNSDGSVLIAVSGGAGSYGYEWKNETGAIVGTAKDLTSVGPGIYSVTVSDGSGCNAYATATIPAELPPTELICLVTVDSATDRNQVVWNETQGKGIIGYILYRETSSAGVFDSIVYIPVDSLSYFIDMYADPEIRSWRYKIAAVNSCGVKSRLSPPHKTMHLTINLGQFDYINLIWNHYEGFVPKFGQYRIWRKAPSSEWQMIDVVPSNLNTYTDKTAPAGDLWYYVEAERLTSCTPLKAATLNSTRSNRKIKLKSLGINEIAEIYELGVWPNPSSGIFTLSMSFQRTENIKIKVLDISGKMVYVEELNGLYSNEEISLDLSGYEKGLYQLHMETENGIFNKILVVQ